MAVYEGARPRQTVLPRRALEAPTLPRRRTRVAVRAGRRTNRVGFLLGGLALAFMLAFFSLAQTVRVSATGYESERLQTERDQLQAQQEELLWDLNRLGRGPAIRKQAVELGLG